MSVFKASAQPRPLATVSKLTTPTGEEEPSLAALALLAPPVLRSFLQPPKPTNDSPSAPERSRITMRSRFIEFPREKGLRGTIISAPRGRTRLRFGNRRRRCSAGGGGAV